MRTVLGLSLVLGLASIGCGGGTHYQQTSSSDDDGLSSGSSTGSTTTAADAGVDVGPVDAGDPVRDRAMALFARSCTPCHRHVAPVDGAAVETGVYLETEEEIVRLAHAYTTGHTPTGLGSLVGQRAEGYDLLVGPEQRLPMPPRGSAYPAWTQEEAQQVQAWFRAH